MYSILFGQIYVTLLRLVGSQPVLLALLLGFFLQGGFDKMQRRAKKQGEPYAKLRGEVHRIETMKISTAECEAKLSQLYEEHNITPANVLAKPLVRVTVFLMLLGLFNAFLHPFTFMLPIGKANRLALAQLTGEQHQMQMLAALATGNFDTQSIFNFTQLCTITEFLELTGAAFLPPAMTGKLWMPILSVTILLAWAILGAIKAKKSTSRFDSLGWMLFYKMLTTDMSLYLCAIGSVFAPTPFAACVFGMVVREIMRRLRQMLKMRVAKQKKQSNIEKTSEPARNEI